jgi:transcriptional regulator with XRE-family HTH domain
MSTPPQDSAPLRRRLRNELREARNRAGLTQREIADRLDWSPSKIIRIESGQVAISMVDLRALLGEYGVTDKSRVEGLVDIARSSRRSSWDEYKDVLPQAGMDYLGFESAAVIVRQYENMLVPGLLQTEAYTRAILPAGGVGQAAVDRLVEARKARQELLDRLDRPELFFVLDEAVIRRLVGGADVMRAQLENLLTLNAKDNVTVQVVPYSVGAYNGMYGPFVHLELSEEDSVLYLESRKETIFQELEGIATDAENFERLIADAISQLKR